MPVHLQIADQILSLDDADYLILAGPTAVGKTALLTDLMKQTALEVVSADTRQVYLGMDIGTATPPRDLLETIPHHLINKLQPDTVWNAGAFLKEARQKIRWIRDRGILPVVVGGAGLYLEALRRGLFHETGKSADHRRELEERLERIGARALWEELQTLDPGYAGSFHWNDHKKLIRAFEIYRATGLTPSQAFDLQDSAFELQERFIVLVRERQELYRRIDLRVAQMLAEGLIGECRTLLQNGFSRELYPLRTIGYKEVFQYLDGELGREEMQELICRNTRKFAKRQLTWFRNHPYDDWIDLGKNPGELDLPPSV